MSTATALPIRNLLGYQEFSIGQFRFTRDEYFAHITHPKSTHFLPVDHFLRCILRDVAWGFFYGTLNFDQVVGTTQHYGTVDLFCGLKNEAHVAANRHYVERFDADDLHRVFSAVLEDWTNEGFDPFAAPSETGSAYGPKHGSNPTALSRQRVVARRMVGLPGDVGYRTDENGYPLNRHFIDVPVDQPEVHAELGFEGSVHAFNLYNYVARSDVTWNPSVVSQVKHSLYCLTTEEYVLPVNHGNDRVEWFVQVSDQIIWDIEDGKTGKPKARVTMKAGDVAAMPADIRHKGYSPKRSLLLVWENGDPTLPQRYSRGELKAHPVEI